MFTGIVETMGVVTRVTDLDGGRQFVITAPEIASELSIGASIAVQGACLTATHRTDSEFTVELVSETLARTSLGGLAEDDPVNLERAMPAHGRFDGHLVQGHVDAVGTVRELTPEGRGARISIAYPPKLGRYVVQKGSITVDGVSLTVADLDEDGVEIALIPHTLEATTLGSLVVSSPVNLEVDILAKYVERLMEARA